jgi:hypothetical protein
MRSELPARIRRAGPASGARQGLAPSIGILLLLVACGSSPPEGSETTPGWEGRQVLADPAVFDSPVGVSLDGDGKGSAIAVWAPATEVYAPVLARRYSATEGWRAVEPIAPAGTGSVNTPTVQMNARGDVVSIWDGYGGLRASSSASGGTWESPALIARPVAQMWSWGLDDEGRALVVWPRGETLGEYREFWANSFDPRLGWGTPHRIAPQEASSRVSSARVFVNSSGDGLAAWLEYEAGAASAGVLHASRYARATGFGPAEILGPSAGSAIAAAIDSAGNVLVVYESGQGLRRQRYGAGRGWQAPEPLEGVGGYDAVPLDDLGNGWVLWNERIDSGTVSLRSRRLAAGVATGPVEEVAPAFAGYAWFRGTPLDTRGGLVAAWFQRGSAPDAAERYALVANRFLATE